MSLARGLSILFTLSKNQLLVLSIFFSYFPLISILLIFLSDLYVFLPSAALGFLCSSFSNCFSWEVRLFKIFFLIFFFFGLFCFLGRAKNFFCHVPYILYGCVFIAVCLEVFLKFPF